MLHRCQECDVVFLTSAHPHLCNGCIEYFRQRVERLHETDAAIEWVRLLSLVANGQQETPRARWEVK